MTIVSKINTKTGFLGSCFQEKKNVHVLILALIPVSELNDISLSQFKLYISTMLNT